LPAHGRTVPTFTERKAARGPTASTPAQS
jgi:hypothetical protein